MSDFLGLRIGLSALQAHKRALDVAGQNMANVNTIGYSRQRANLKSVDAGSVSAIHSNWTETGQGVRVDSVGRVYDRFLQSRSLVEHSAQGSLARTQTALSRIELGLNEPSDNGLSAQIADFQAAWDDLANHPENAASRQQVVDRGQTLATGLRTLDHDLTSLRASTLTELGGVVGDVNDISRQVAQLNRQIQVANISGNDTANELTDQRDQLVAHLAEKLGATVKAGENGSVDVFLGGMQLVRGANAEQLRVAVGSPPAQNASVVFDTTGQSAPVGGEAGGLVAVINDTIPRYRSQIGDVTTTIATEVNTTHQSGFDLNGAAGVAFFVTGPNGIEVSSAIAADTKLLAVSSAAGTTRDGSVAAKLAALTGGQNAYTSLVSRLGSEAASVNRQLATQQSVTTQVDAARDSVSGVNLDEEMVDLVASQHAYQAASRFISAIDSMLDTLINSTGRVGR